MARLAISLLGPTQVVLPTGAPAVFPYDKVVALLAWLVVERDRPHRRESLAGLLWPEQPEAAARHSLSQALWALRQRLGDALPLAVSRATVGLAPEAEALVVVDVARVERLLDRAAGHTAHPADAAGCPACAAWLSEAVDGYRAPFLDGFALPDSVAFDEWMLVTRERLHGRICWALERLAHHHAASGDHELAIARLRRLLALDPWREPAQRELMRLLAASGQRADALRSYLHYRALLAEELGVEPGPETSALYEALRQPPLSASPMAPLPPAALPAPSTPFVGRERELARLAQLLEDASCRLITICGPGGIGKTRLAIQAVSDMAGRFAEGARFVALAGIRDPEQLPAAVGGALGLRLDRGIDPAEAVPELLRERELLLVLDNLEQLIDAAPWVGRLVERAPRLRVLVTSRERLRLRDEWTVELDGLALPQAGDDPGALSGALLLFHQATRRARGGLGIAGEELADARRICRLTGGMPLAIELAAAWTPVLACGEIAAELERGLDLLAVELRDLPARHRSIRAVFDHSWALLSDAERGAFRRLAVFRGGFDRAAAETVAGARLPVLSALVARSMLRRTPAGRYELHELLREYGAERLAQVPDEAALVSERHSRYYLGLLASDEPALRGERQLAALAAIGSELDNVRAAWRWAIARRRADIVAGALFALWLFSEIRGSFARERDLFEDTIAAFDGAPPGSDAELVLARALLACGSQFVRHGEHPRGLALVDRALAIARDHQRAADIGLALNFRASFDHMSGDLAGELRDLNESIAQLALAGDRWALAYSLNDLGIARLHAGEVDEAQRLAHEGLALARATGDRRGMSFALHNLGVIAASRGELDAAGDYLQQALTLRRALGHHWGTAASLAALGGVLRERGVEEEALSTLRAALQAARAILSRPLVLAVLAEIIALPAFHEGLERDRAVAMLRAIACDPDGERATHARACELLHALAPEATAVVPGADGDDGADLIDARVRELLRPALAATA